jgi:hypothetical protein
MSKNAVIQGGLISKGVEGIERAKKFKSSGAASVLMPEAVIADATPEGDIPPRTRGRAPSPRCLNGVSPVIPEPRTGYYFVTIRREGIVVLVSAAGEIENVSHVFQPAGRFSEANSP